MFLFLFLLSISSHVRSAQIENKFAPYSTEMSPYNMNIYMFIHIICSYGEKYIYISDPMGIENRSDE